MPLRKIVTLVARVYGKPVKSLLESKRAVANEPRSIAIFLSRSLEDYPLQVVADYFGINHYSRISKVYGEVKRQLEENLEMKTNVDQIISELITKVKT